MPIRFISIFLLIALSASAQENQAPEWTKPLVEEKIPEADPEILAGDEGFLVSAEKAPAIPSLEKAMSAKVRLMTFRRPVDFDYEFTLLVVEGKIKRAFIVSTSMPGKSPILGIHRLSAPVLDTLPHKPFPWRTSKSYFNSPMYWALNITGGYFIHSSPHYGNLGHPASMGCIRESIPDAMEVFDTVVNQYSSSPSYSIIFDQLKLGSGTDAEKALLATLSASEWSINQLKAALKESRTEVTLVSKGDLEYAPGIPVDAHVRPFGDTPQVETSFPTCGGVDCWDLFHKKRTTLKLRPYIAYKNPPKDDYVFDQTLSLATREIISASPAKVVSTLNLNEALNGSLTLLDPLDLVDVTLSLSSLETPLLVRICDTAARVCSKARGPDAGLSADFVFPMHEVAGQLKSTAHLILQVTGGSGTLKLMKVRFYH